MKKIELKPIIVTILLIAFQSICFLLSKVIQGSPYLIGNKIDTLIPFNIWFIIPYCIWYILIFTVPYSIYKKNKDSFVKYIYCYIFVTLIANIIFVIFPTTVARPDVEATNILTFMAKTVFMVDTPVCNCFPSLHCAVSMLFIAFVFENKNFKNISKILITAISVLIMIATLFVKQHVFVDLLSGNLLALLCYFGISYNYKKNNRIKKLLKI